MTTTLTDPSARLVANRAHLRIQLLASQSRAGESTSRRASPHYSVYAIGLLAALAQGGTPTERLVAWWKTLPFSQALGTVAESVETLLEPVARRHPARLMLGALLTGAVIAWIRPWRWFSTGSVAETVRATVDLVSTHDPKGELLAGLLERLFRQPDRPAP
jgi:hypothetical protein